MAAKKMGWISMALVHNVFASIGSGLIGGSSTPDDTNYYYYAALVDSSGNVIALNFSPDTLGGIVSVAMNANGIGLIGGQTSATTYYAAFVNPDNTLTPIPSLPSATGVEITSVAINTLGSGLIAGQPFSGTAYAAFVANGVATAISGGSWDVNILDGIHVAINDSNNGIIIANHSPSVTGTSTISFTSGSTINTEISVLHGYLSAVAFNNSGNGLVGGQSYGLPYLGIISAGTVTTASGLPAQGNIETVAINQTGLGIIAGVQNAASPYIPYAAMIDSLHNITALTGDSLPTNGSITASSLNASGDGIIGGVNGSNNPYVALIHNGSLLNVTDPSLPTHQTVSSVSINASGVSLISTSDPSFGASSGIPGYAALIAPNGAFTVLPQNTTWPTGLSLVSVAAPSELVATVATPKSIGPYTGAIQGQLAASFALTSHIGVQRKFWNLTQTHQHTAFLTDASDTLCVNQKPKTTSIVPKTQPSYTVWATPFGSYIHQSSNGSTPLINNEVAGVLTAFDYRSNNFLVGGGLGYGYNYLHYGQSLGHGHVQEEMAYIYGSYQRNNAWFDIALWGGVYQAFNERHSVGGLATSKAHIHGYLFNPHLEAAYSYAVPSRPWLTVEPFAMFDWVNNWQGHFKESELTFFFADNEMAILDACDSCRIVAAVFELS